MKLILFLILALSLFACSPDKDVYSVPTGIDTLNTGWKKVKLPLPGWTPDVFFINNTTGYALTDGAIFRSTNGGDTWQKVYQSEGIGANIGMGDVNHAVFTSVNNKVFYTSNGGNSFDSVDITDHIEDVFFTGALTAYAVGQKTWKTNNGGMTWTQVSSFTPNGFSNPKILYFLNEQTGWVTGTGLFKTTTGGVNWDAVPGATGVSQGGEGAVFFPDANTGFATTTAFVFKSVNGGASFNQIFTPNKPAFHDIHFLDPQTGYMTDYNYILKTTDGGLTWNKEVVLEGEELIELHFTDASHGWASGSKGSILIYKP